METFINKEILSTLGKLEQFIQQSPLIEKISLLNYIRTRLNHWSPFKDEPVDCVQWIPVTDISKNSYNPNHIAPPEMRLLFTSLTTNGFTHPLVICKEGSSGKSILVDGFHRYMLAKKRAILRERFHGHVPVITLPVGSLNNAQKIAATVRHNRARGQHQIQEMSAIVQELSRLGWDDTQISTELGMDKDEVLRLKQISGLYEIFQDHEFSQAWTTE